MVWTAGSILEGQTKLIAELKRADGRTLWQARDEDAERDVLVEIARGSWRRDSAALIGFHAAAEAALTLRHPSVVAVLAHGLDGERWPYVVRETTPAATMMTEVGEHGSLGLRRVARVVEQLLRVLDLVHAKGLAQGGVTPDLVYLTARGEVKLWVELVSLRPTRAARDLCCAAPERLFEGHEADPRSSLWEVAALAYYALSGRAPFVAPNPTALAASVADGHFSRIALRGDGGEASRIELDAWFKKALAKRAEDRFATARAMLDAWQNVVGGLLLFVADDDAGAVTLVPPPNDDDRVALRPSGPPPDTEPTAIFGGPAYSDSEDVTRVSHGHELASLLDDEGEVDTVISVRAEDLEPDESAPAKRAPDGPPPTARSIPSARDDEPFEPVGTSTPPSGRQTEFPLTRSVRPELQHKRGVRPFMLAAALVIAGVSSATTTWLSSATAPDCDCSATASAPAPCLQQEAKPASRPVTAPPRAPATARTRAPSAPTAVATAGPQSAPPPTEPAASPRIIWPSPVHAKSSAPVPVAVTPPAPVHDDADDPYD